MSTIEEQIQESRAWLRNPNMLRTLHCDRCMRRLDRNEAIFECWYPRLTVGVYCCAFCASEPPWGVVALARGGQVPRDVPDWVRA